MYKLESKRIEKTKGQLINYAGISAKTTHLVKVFFLKNTIRNDMKADKCIIDLTAHTAVYRQNEIPLRIFVECSLVLAPNQMDREKDRFKKSNY